MEEVRRLRAFETPTQKTKRKAKANAKRGKVKFRFNPNMNKDKEGGTSGEQQPRAHVTGAVVSSLIS